MKRLIFYGVSLCLILVIGLSDASQAVVKSQEDGSVLTVGTAIPILPGPAITAAEDESEDAAITATTIAMTKTPMMADETPKARMPHFRQLQFREIVSGKSPLS